MSSTGVKNYRQLISIAKNSGLGITGKIYFSVSRFLLTVFITRTIGPEQYGIYMLGLTFLLLIRALVLLGMESAMVRFVALHLARKEDGQVKGVIDSGIKIAAASSLLISITIFILAYPIAVKLFDKSELVPILRILVMALPFMALTQIFLSALQGATLVKYGILIDEVLRPTIRFIVIAAAFAIGLRLIGVVWAWVIAALILFLLSGYFLKQETSKLKQKKVKVKIKTVFEFSLPLWMSRIITKNNRHIGLLLIGIFLAADQAGIYSVGMRMTPFILIPFMAYNAIFSPIISSLYANQKFNELESIYKIGTRWVISLTLPIFVLMILFSSEIVLIFGRGFSDSYRVLIILLIAEMINVSTGSTSYVLSMTGKPLYNLMNSMIVLTLNIFLSVIMIKKFGTVGAAYALGISIITVNFLQLVEVYYLFRIHPFSLGHLKPFVSCFFSGLIVLFLRTQLRFLSPYVVGVIIFVVFSLSYLIFLSILGLSSEDRLILKNIGERFNKFGLRGINQNSKRSLLP